MKEQKIAITVKIYTYNELPAAYQTIVDMAKKQTEQSYAPYSKFHVGAAILLEDGKITTGNNQENVAYPSGLCAERVAMFYANALHPAIAPKALDIAAFTDGAFLSVPIAPCGACRQVLLESEARYGKDIEILLCGEKEIILINSCKDLLPLSFGREFLM